MRVDLYTFVHKAQRFQLFQLANEISTADFENADEAERIAKQVRSMIEHLKDHAKNEEIYIHPLYAKIGKKVDHLEKEHHELENEISHIEKIVELKRWDDLYPQYTQFLGRYLLHLAGEESAQQDVLWKHCDDQALLAVFNRFKSERAPQAAREDLERMLHALNVTELTRMFLGMKASAPSHIFQGACGLAAGILAPEKWQKLKGEL